MEPDYLDRYSRKGNYFNHIFHRWESDFSNGNNHKGGTGFKMNSDKRNKARKNRKKKIK